MNDSVFNYLSITENDKDGCDYKVIRKCSYYSKRYKKRVTAKIGEDSDGATGARDIDSFGWLYHDMLKKYKKWDDGTECPNRHASFVLYDILKEEGYWFRARSWYISTLLWGTFVK